jgi:hypothetical protein
VKKKEKKRRGVKIETLYSPVGVLNTDETRLQQKKKWFFIYGLWKERGSTSDNNFPSTG